MRSASDLLLFGGECIQRTAGGAEMPPGEMQIDRRFLKVAMSQQHLNGSQVGTGFEQMSGKTVSQGMGMDVFVLQGRRVRRPAAEADPENLVETG